MPFQKGNKEYLKKKPMTEEQRKKASENNSGPNNPCYNRPRPQSEKDAISIALKGKPKDPKVIAKIAAANTGQKRTAEQNKAKSERMTLYYIEHPEARESARNKALAQWQDPDIRDKCTEANRIAAQNPVKKAKISQTITRLWQDEEYAVMMSNSHKGQIAWNKDIPMAEESKKKLSISLTGLFKGEKNPFYGKHHTAESNEKNRQSQKNTSLNPEVKERRSIVQKIAQNRPEVKIKTSQSLKIVNSKPEAKEKHSKRQTKLWRDPEYRMNQLIAIGKGLCRLPNRPETLIDIITYEYWTRWKYTGDYFVVINGKNPDFVNEEQKLIIEVYGDYWHRGEDPTDRAEIFAQAGYETCVIWESELSNLDHVILKLRRFMGDRIY